MQQNKHLKNQPHFAEIISTIIKRASQQKMLPKIIWSASRQFGNKKMLDYQKTIKKQYQQQLKNPIKYNPQEAKSSREKFRQKVLKLMNNQLQVEYFQNQKHQNKHIITYQGHGIQERPIETKKQYSMFQNFNEKRFKQTYNNMFDDKLELEIDQIYPVKMKSKRCHTLNLIQVSKNDQEVVTPIQRQPIIIPVLRPSTPKKTIRHHTQNKAIESVRKKSPVIYFNNHKVVGKQIETEDPQKQVLYIMKSIGKFSNSTAKDKVFLTKQSIIRYIKSIYDKPHRIVDFLQIKDVVSFDQFNQITKKLRVMPNQHLLFLTFLFYDHNNDGYIDDFDVDKINSLGDKRPVLHEDYKKIKKNGFKKHLTSKSEYHQLYKLTEITQTTFFEWKKEKDKRTQKQEPENIIKEIELEMKNRVLSSRQKHIFLDFEAFCFIYKNEKPFLWYDLLKILSNISFQGLIYE